MCKECGCEHEHTIDVNQSVNAANDSLADHILHLLTGNKTFCINIMGAPGSGKTTLIEALSKNLKHLAVIQGDLESDVDKKRLEKLGITTYQINTHSGCHLNAMMINKAILGMDLSGKEYLIIENVGNLVCPAGVKLGQHCNIVVSSTAEGHDKPLKYPHIYRDADVVVISKYDLRDAVDFDEEKFVTDLKKVCTAEVFRVSKKGKGFSEVAHEIEHLREHEFGIEHMH